MNKTQIQPFKKERAEAMRVSSCPESTAVKILVASDETMNYIELPVWLDTGMQGPLMISPAQYRALGSPRIVGSTVGTQADGKATVLSNVVLTLSFGNMLFFDVCASINPAFDEIGLLGMAILQCCTFYYIGTKPELVPARTSKSFTLTNGKKKELIKK